MEASLNAPVSDFGSDYGSDFTADEEELLRGLVDNRETEEVDNPIKRSQEELQATEEHDTPRVAILPPGSHYNLRSGTKVQPPSGQTSHPSKVKLDLEEHVSAHSKATLPFSYSG